MNDLANKHQAVMLRTHPTSMSFKASLFAFAGDIVNAFRQKESALRQARAVAPVLAVPNYKLPLGKTEIEERAAFEQHVAAMQNRCGSMPNPESWLTRNAALPQAYDSGWIEDQWQGWLARANTVLTDNELHQIEFARERARHPRAPGTRSGGVGC